MKLTDAGIRRLICAVKNMTPCGVSFDQMMKELNKWELSNGLSVWVCAVYFWCMSQILLPPILVILSVWYGCLE